MYRFVGSSAIAGFFALSILRPSSTSFLSLSPLVSLKKSCNAHSDLGAKRELQPTKGVLLFVHAADSSSSSSSNSNSNTSPATKNELSRTLFLSDALALASFIAIVSPPTPAFAGDDSVARKGTKEDPKFQACLSLCMYDCTKPKGAEQRSRSECLPECKQKCATTKQQLLLGSPKD